MLTNHILEQLRLFDSTSVPILTYGCEVWGFEKMKEKVHTDFLKYILNVNKVHHTLCCMDSEVVFLCTLLITKELLYFGIIYSSEVTGCLQLYIALFSKIYKWLINVKHVLPLAG